MFENFEISQIKTFVIVGVLICLLILERLFPVVLWSRGLWRIGRNFGLSGFNAILSPLIVLPIVQFADGHSLGWRGDVFDAQWMIIFDLLILDLWIYWWHRINHLSQFLWRFHEVHHLDDTLDATSALRFHFGEVFLSSLVRAGVILVLDIPFFSVVIFEILVAVSAMFHHSNLRLPPRLENTMAFFVVTPKMHWVHHHAVRADTDSNYSAILSVWDKVFGSASATIRTPDMPIGVEGLGDRNLVALLFRPFRKK